jgi:hypothetical protein
MKLIFRIAVSALLAISVVSGVAGAQGRRTQGQQLQGQNNRQNQRANAMLQNMLEQISAQSDPLQLVFRKDVQHDMQMDLGQRNKFDNLHDRQLKELQQSRMQNRRNPATVVEFQKAQRKEVQEKIDTLLTPQQKTRLGQIVLQIQGNAAVFDPAMQKTLGVTREQRERINQISQERQAKLARLQTSVAQGEIVVTDMNDMVGRILTEANDALSEVLTTEQTDQLKKMQGPPFKAG